MNNFLNYENGTVSISTSRLVNAQATDVNDIVNAFDNQTSEVLSATLDVYIEEELAKIDLSICDDIGEAVDYIFGEADFLELTLNSLNIDIADYPDLRDYQHDFINDYFIS